MYEKYISLLISLSDYMVKKVLESGNAFEGKNGPYNNKDTALRNSTHWYQIFAFLYHETKEEIYKECSDRLLLFITNAENYGSNMAPKCRTDANIDDINGLIGPAWTIEGLIYAYRNTREFKLLDIAYDIFLSQEFDTKDNLWRIIDTQGKNWGYDLTFNHQLWFAAVGYELASITCEDPRRAKVENQCNMFGNNITKHLRYYPNGLFCHIAYMGYSGKYKLKYYIKKYLRYVSGVLCLKNKYSEMYNLEKGYLCFDLYGFAILKQYNPNLQVFSDSIFRKAVELGTNEDFLMKMANEIPFNKYAFAYNSPAFEYPFVAKMLRGTADNKLCKKLLDKQINLTMGIDNTYLTSNVNDPNTLKARAYELIRFLDLECD